MNEAKGNVYYGLHFYPGVAEYREHNQSPYRVFLREDTIRDMGPSFAGRPVFVSHVDEIAEDREKLRNVADGWVVESFYNQADGKHWAKFIIVSEQAEKAIAQGMKLSNCYIPSSFGPGGIWNGVDYDKEITSAEYEHLAIVPNPRYEESLIFTPEQFKKYNEDKLSELKKFANQKGTSPMKFNFFKRAKVENSIDLESLSVMLPKSKVEVSIEKLINEADEALMKKDDKKIADLDAVVTIEGEDYTIAELIEKLKEFMMPDGREEVIDTPIVENEDEDDSMDNEEDKDKEKEIQDKKKKMPMKENRKTNSFFNKLRNAEAKSYATHTPASIDLSSDKLARGKALFGAN